MEFQVRWNRCKICIRHEIDFFFLHLFEVSSVGFEHQSVSHCYECNKQSFFIIEANIAMAPFNEIENNNCFKIYPARSDLKKSERKPLKHDYFEFLIDRSINAWKAFMLP